MKHSIAAMLVAAALLTSAAPSHAQDRISVARAAAIHECSVMAQRFPETTFASTEFELYRACMAQRGQVE